MNLFTLDFTSDRVYRAVLSGCRGGFRSDGFLGIVKGEALVKGRPCQTITELTTSLVSVSGRGPRSISISISMEVSIALDVKSAEFDG